MSPNMSPDTAAFRMTRRSFCNGGETPDRRLHWSEAESVDTKVEQGGGFFGVAAGGPVRTPATAAAGH